MRLLYKRLKYSELEAELQLVESVLSSGYFILLDIFFLSSLLTVLTFSLHHSFLVAFFTFISFYIVCSSIFFLLRKWLQ
ncbi:MULTISPECIES: hypothetical protein [Bacillus cereus group]|uniref:hypothetical protein n=1 Tax=Bacillus cereus group TaxID=86661 RepID=UPI000330D233|nr:hypothetical protein [Bacillus cereus]EOO14698.1 hypothetical protein IG9_03866 [Bacillus cereus HuA2-9]MCZ6939249.1 hypothetical protein [Bacillus mycoides]